MQCTVFINSCYWCIVLRRIATDTTHTVMICVAIGYGHSDRFVATDTTHTVMICVAIGHDHSDHRFYLRVGNGLYFICLVEGLQCNFYNGATEMSTFLAGLNDESGAVPAMIVIPGEGDRNGASDMCSSWCDVELK